MLSSFFTVISQRMIYHCFLALSHVFVKVILTGLTEAPLFAISIQAVSPFHMPPERR
jgi:hypothetical protein